MQPNNTTETLRGTATLTHAKTLHANRMSLSWLMIDMPPFKNFYSWTGYRTFGKRTGHGVIRIEKDKAVSARFFVFQWHFDTKQFKCNKSFASFQKAVEFAERLEAEEFNYEFGHFDDELGPNE